MGGGVFAFVSTDIIIYRDIFSGEISIRILLIYPLGRPRNLKSVSGSNHHTRKGGCDEPQDVVDASDWLHIGLTAFSGM
jgi:hypothetical protein